MEYTLEQLREKLHNLPEDVQDAIFAVETTEAIGTIQKKYQLHIDQAGELAEEVGLVMLGLTRPFDFVSRIATRLRITQLVASQITKDINEAIFNPIKESLKQIHSLNEQRGATTKTQPSDIPSNPINTHPSSIQKPEQGNEPQATQIQEKNTSDQLFDQKLKGLFASSNTTPTNNDPYREPLA